MKKWIISVLDSEIYKDIEADTEKEAIEKVLALWAERIPDIAVQEDEEKWVGTRCETCSYFWKEEDEETPSCHYGWDDGYAPCEIDDIEDYEEDDYDCGFDPYIGCYSDDC